MGSARQSVFHRFSANQPWEQVGETYGARGESSQRTKTAHASSPMRRPIVFTTRMREGRSRSFGAIPAARRRSGWGRMAACMQPNPRASASCPTAPAGDRKGGGAKCRRERICYHGAWRSLLQRCEAQDGRVHRRRRASRASVYQGGEIAAPSGLTLSPDQAMLIVDRRAVAF